MRAKWMVGLVLVCLSGGTGLRAQTKDAPAAPAATAAAPAQTKSAAAAKTPEELNTQEYITLLRKDVNAQKARLLGEVMQFDAASAAKFWPIYHNYDVELSKLNDMRVANIKEYAANYTTMTDDKADELIKNAMTFQKQRDELLLKYYEQVKAALGGITAARFLQVEHQLLLIIDLKIASSLPVVGQ
jgi:pyruvate/2-oxoglutarate dehydrogenase complex dihydrolipoamide acyltransferase (E2) component